MSKAAVSSATVPAAPTQARGPRSPNFPSISLSDALAKARVLYDKDKRASSSLKTVLGHLGFGQQLSGSAGRVISAFRQFGLLEETGGQYRITEAAMRIFTLSESAPERIAAIQEAAKKPAIYRDVLAQYADGLPSDAAFKDFLILKKKFNPDSVDTFIRVFKATMEFAKLTPGAYTPIETENPSVPVIGDYVQWESQGVLQFEVPRKVTYVSPDGAYVMVEGSATGIPMEQVAKADAPTGGTNPNLLHIPAMKPLPGIAREVFSLGEGEAILQWPTTLNADGIEDLEAWLALVVKKLKRLKGVPSND